jgi:DNA-binding response OmpR family regulator
MRAFIKATIKSSISKDIEVDEAGNGAAAQGKLQITRYDLVLCDWNMPGMKGNDLLQWVRSQEAIQDTPFIMITGHNEKEIIMESLGFGVKDYIMKPVTTDALSSKIGAVLRAIISARVKRTDQSAAGGASE